MWRDFGGEPYPHDSIIRVLTERLHDDSESIAAKMREFPFVKAHQLANVLNMEQELIIKDSKYLCDELILQGTILLMIQMPTALVNFHMDGTVVAKP